MPRLPVLREQPAAYSSLEHLMSEQNRSCWHVALVMIGATCSAPVLATPSGLNNIPTADTAGEGDYVFQAFSNFGERRRPDNNLGFKTGLGLFGEKFEVGLDGRITPDKGGPAVAQVKYARSLWDGTSLGVGIANIAFRSQDRDRAGNPSKYGIVTQKLGNLRLHGGYGFQTDNDSVLLGADYSLKFSGRDLVIRSDVIEINDGDQFLGSLGFLLVINSSLVLESWASKPEDGGTVGTLKFNFIF
jgi:hypothetical protein